MVAMACATALPRRCLVVYNARSLDRCTVSCRWQSSATKKNRDGYVQAVKAVVYKTQHTNFGDSSMKTFSAKPQSVQRDWFVVDATDKTLGRLATEIARRLRGKHKPEYTPHVDTGDYIVVVNAEKVKVTGNKAQAKNYYRHTGYPGGLRSMNFEKMIDHAPERIIESAVKGMLPKGPLGRAMYSKLKVYAGAEHPHAAQQPQELNL